MKFAYFHFDETLFPSLWILKASMNKKKKRLMFSHEIRRVLSHLDLCTLKCENEVQQIIHLQIITNKLPNAFNNSAKIAKFHSLTINNPAQIVIT